MTITIGSWVIPLVSMVALWIACVMWPCRPAGGFWGASLDELLHLVVAVFCTLTIWLVYFATRFVFG
jgi:hypothetical protein